MEDLTQGIVSNPKYFKILPSGDFENEQYEDENDWEEEMDDERLMLAKPPEKREVVVGTCILQLKMGRRKKGRFGSFGETL